jgi:hypothetical protein
MRRYLSGRWRTRPSPDRFVAVRPCGFEGRVIGTPMKSDVPFPVNGSALVEFYAR